MEALVVEIQNRVKSAEALVKKCVLLKLTINTIGNSRKVSTSEIEADADKALLRVSKKLLDSPELDAIRELDGDSRRRMYKLCLPFEPGLHFLPLSLLERVDNELREAQTERETLIENFISAYVRLRDEARDRLRSLYDATDYPDPEALRPFFGMGWNYITLEVPASFADVSESIFDQEREKIAKRMERAYDDISGAMRTAMLELVNRLRDRLTPTEDGKTKRLHASTVEALQEFLQTFSFRNVTDDEDLSRLVSQVRESMSTVPDIDALRDSEALRVRVLESMSAASDQLEVLVNEGRKIRFTEAE